MSVVTAPLVLLWRRVRAHWRFLVVLFSGVLLATTLLAATPLYLGAMKELGLRHALEFERTGVPHTAINVPFRPLDQSGYDRTRAQIQDRTSETIQPLVVQEVAHIATPPLDLTIPSRGLFETGLVVGAIQSYSDYEEHSIVVEGEFPRPTGRLGELGPIIDVAIGRGTAAAMGLGMGDQIPLFPSAADQSRAITVNIVGILEPVDFSELYWLFSLNPFTVQLDASRGGEIPLIPFIIPQETFFEDMAPAFRGTLVNFWWFFYVDPDRIDANDVEAVQEDIANLENNLSNDLPGSIVLTGLADTLALFDQKLFFSRIPVLVMLVLVTAVVLYYLVMVANAVVDRHMGEIALLRSRGANSGQVMAVYMWEAFFISLIAFILGPLLAFLIVPLLGQTPAFSSVTGGSSLPIDLSATAFLFALVGAALSFLVLLFPALRGASFNVLNEKARMARPAAVSAFHKYYIDIFLLALSGVLYWELTQRGSLVTRRLFGSDSTDQVLLIAPVVFMAGLSLLFLRAFPIAIRLLSLMASRTGKVWLVMGLWNIGRNPVHYIRPILLLMLVSGLAMVATSFNSTLERTFRDRDLYSSGSDARLVGIPPPLSGSKDDLARQFERDPGVLRAGAAFRSDPRTSVGSVSQSFNLLAVDSIRFNSISFYRDDFSDQSLFALLRKLDRGRSTLRGLDLPEGTTSLGVWVKPAQDYVNISLWVRVRSESGDPIRVKLGRLDFEDWRFLQADLATSSGRRLEGPLVLESIYAWEFDYPDNPQRVDLLIGGHVSSGQFNLSDLTAFTQSGAGGNVVDPFTSADRWGVLAISALLPETLTASDEITREGQSTLEYSWQSRPGLGIRGLIPSELDEPLPIIAGGRFLATTGRRVGESMEISVGSIPVPVIIADAVELFPTMNPSSSFVIGNLDTLLYYSNLFRFTPALPNEVWLSLSENEEDREAFVTGLQSSPLGPFLVLERQDALNSLEVDPLVGAGSGGIVFAILIVLILVSVVGYLGYFYVSSYRAPLEFAVLRALGLSIRQLTGLQLLIHSTIMLSAILLGAWIGTRAHSMIITFLQHNDRGREVQPPFATHTDWSGLGIILLASLGTLLAVMVWQNLSFSRVPIWRVLRKGEE